MPTNWHYHCTGLQTTWSILGYTASTNVEDLRQRASLIWYHVPGGGGGGGGGGGEDGMNAVLRWSQTEFHYHMMLAREYEAIHIWWCGWLVEFPIKAQVAAGNKPITVMCKYAPTYQHALCLQYRCYHLVCCLLIQEITKSSATKWLLISPTRMTISGMWCDWHNLHSRYCR